MSDYWTLPGEQQILCLSCARRPYLVRHAFPVSKTVPQRLKGLGRMKEISDSDIAELEVEKTYCVELLRGRVGSRIGWWSYGRESAEEDLAVKD